MKESERVSRRALLLLHAESLAEHGGLEGIRDEGLLDSALARPLNVSHITRNVTWQIWRQHMPMVFAATTRFVTETNEQHSSLPDFSWN